MPSAFRNDFDAARARADALSEENEDLREELDRLRHTSEKPPERREDPAMAKLAESTLERLEHLTEEPETQSVMGPPKRRDLTPTPHAPAEDANLNDLIPKKREASLKPVDLATNPIERELEDLRRTRSRLVSSVLMAFLAGVFVGIVLSAIAR